MDIYLIRHTTPKVDKGICYGVSDLDVVETFPQEAAAVKAVLPAYDADKIDIISSPLIRCRQLAYFVAPAKEVLLQQNLKEISFGDWELKPWKSIDKEALNSWFMQYVEVPPPNGESFQTVYDRAIAALELAKKTSKKQLWVVAHSGIIRAILCHYQGTPLKDAFKAQMGYGAVYKIETATKKVISLK